MKAYIFLLLFGVAAFMSAASHALAAEAGQDDTETSNEKITSTPDQSGTQAMDKENISAEAPASTPDNPAPDQPDQDEPYQQTYTGVENRHFEATVDGGPTINIFYPAFSTPAVDTAIKTYVENIVAGFENEVKEITKDEEERPSGFNLWTLVGTFTLERPNPGIASITFSLYSFTGGAHGNLIIDCLNYDLKTGQQLDFNDIFRDPEKALKVMSELTAQKLRVDLGEDADEDMIQDGTKPELANFKNLSLGPNGVFVEFQPYQVGPWSIGPQHVALSLADLAECGPSTVVWPEQDAKGAEAIKDEQKK